MRGPDDRSEGLFSYVSCEARVPQGHPLRAIRAIVDEALEVLSPAFDRPGIAFSTTTLPAGSFAWEQGLPDFEHSSGGGDRAGATGNSSARRE